MILCVALAPRIPELMRTQSLTFQLVRSLFLLGATLCFFTGLGTIQVAEASAIMFTAPLMLTAAAPFVLKEKVGVRRWVSVIIGFIGAMIIIRPGQGALAEGAFWVLGAAACYACYQLSTRALSGQDSVLTTLFYSALLGALIMSAVVPFHFVMFAPIDWAIMALAGLFGTVGHFCHDQGVYECRSLASRAIQLYEPYLGVDYRIRTVRHATGYMDVRRRGHHYRLGVVHHPPRAEKRV